jgi:hypothetical protein
MRAGNTILGDYFAPFGVSVQLLCVLSVLGGEVFIFLGGPGVLGGSASRLQMRVKVVAQELVEMPQAVFHRRLAGTGCVQALPVERLAARGDARAGSRLRGKNLLRQARARRASRRPESTKRS